MALINRVKSILMSPATEWQVIDGESPRPARSTPATSFPWPHRADRAGHRLLGLRDPGAVHRHRVADADRHRAERRGGELRAHPDRRVCSGARHRRPGADLRRDQEPDPGAQGGRLLQHGELAAGIFALLPGLRVLGSWGSNSLYLLYLACRC